MRDSSDKGQVHSSEERGFLRNARSFLLGGALGASAALAARRHHRRRGHLPDGLSAFEDAPCFRESAERRR